MSTVWLVSCRWVTQSGPRLSCVSPSWPHPSALTSTRRKRPSPPALYELGAPCASAWPSAFSRRRTTASDRWGSSYSRDWGEIACARWESRSAVSSNVPPAAPALQVRAALESASGRPPIGGGGTAPSFPRGPAPPVSLVELGSTSSRSRLGLHRVRRMRAPGLLVSTRRVHLGSGAAVRRSTAGRRVTVLPAVRTRAGIGGMAAVTELPWLSKILRGLLTSILVSCSVGDFACGP